MKYLFSLVVIQVNPNDFTYVNSCKLLIKQILELTTYDVLLTTNVPQYFESEDRFVIRNVNMDGLILKYAIHFNFNLKYLGFDDIPNNYDYVFYMDADLSITLWDDDAFDKLILNYDFIGTRLNCSIESQLKELNDIGTCLFKHKLTSYKNLLDYEDNFLKKSIIPSEHFFILKNDNNKVQKFHDKWKELNIYMQSINAVHGIWGDGFEIGVSALFAGFETYNDIHWGQYFKLNGNRIK